MNRKYIVRLSDEERAVCQEIVKRLKGASEKVKRAQVPLKGDADGPGWQDAKIADAYGCTVRMVEKLRERLVTGGFATALERQPRATSPTPRTTAPTWPPRHGPSASGVSRISPPSGSAWPPA